MPSHAQVSAADNENAESTAASTSLFMMSLLGRLLLSTTNRRGPTSDDRRHLERLEKSAPAAWRFNDRRWGYACPTGRRLQETAIEPADGPQLWRRAWRRSACRRAASRRTRPPRSWSSAGCPP